MLILKKSTNDKKHAILPSMHRVVSITDYSFGDFYMVIE